MKLFMIGVSEVEFHVLDIDKFILALQCLIVEDEPVNYPDRLNTGYAPIYSMSIDSVVLHRKPG